MRNQRYAPLLAGLASLLLVLAPPAFGQGSANFKLTPGVLGVGGTSASISARVTGEAGVGTRLSSTNHDIIGGMIGGAFSPQANVTITTVGGAFASIGVPVRAPNMAPTSVFDELGGIDNTAWRLGRFSPGTNAYVEAGAGLSAVEPYKGYWLITAGATNSIATGLPVRNEPQIIDLENGPSNGPGFNQMANPFLFPIAVASIGVSDGVALPDFITSHTGSLTEQNVRVWNGSGYTTLSNNTNVINGRTAFWVRKLAAGTVKLWVLPVPATTGSPAPVLARPPGTLWAVAVQPTQGTLAAEPLMFGAAQVAEGEWNPYSIARAPSPPGRHLAAYANKADWGRMSGEYVTEFRPPAALMEWDFIVESAEAPGQMALTLSTFDVPAGARMWLTDELSGERAEVVAGQSLPFAAVEGPRRFRIAVSTAGIEPAAAPFEQRLRFAYPNPFRGEVGLAFAMAAPGEIRVEIFDAQGRRIRTLARRVDGPGEQVIVWDGRDTGGRSVENGVYLARYQAGDVRGTRRLVRMN